MCEKAFSYLTIIKRIEKIVSSRLRITSMYVYLTFDLELRICVAKDWHRFHVREACFALSNGSESNIFLVYLLEHGTFCLDLPYVFSTLPVKDKPMIN